LEEELLKPDLKMHNPGEAKTAKKISALKFSGTLKQASTPQTLTTKPTVEGGSNPQHQP
jgi:hypothetical protein